jgi:hypothetical protein
VAQKFTTTTLPLSFSSSIVFPSEVLRAKFGALPFGPAAAHAKATISPIRTETLKNLITFIDFPNNGR